MVLPAGYLITWTTYGTWLHGDPRGSVDSRHNSYGTAPLEASSSLRADRVAKLSCEPFELSDAARSVVEHAVRRHALLRRWDLLEVAARTNHVHAVVRRPLVKPEVMLRQFKDWATRDLRGLDLLAAGRSPWTRHGSTRWLWDEPSVLAAARYVSERQEGAGYWLAQRRLRALQLAKEAPGSDTRAGLSPPQRPCR